MNNFSKGMKLNYLWNGSEDGYTAIQWSHGGYVNLVSSTSKKHLFNS